jgi:hypothetical protein
MKTAPSLVKSILVCIYTIVVSNSFRLFTSSASVDFNLTQRKVLHWQLALFHSLTHSLTVYLTNPHRVVKALHWSFLDFNSPKEWHGKYNRIFYQSGGKHFLSLCINLRALHIFFPRRGSRKARKLEKVKLWKACATIGKDQYPLSIFIPGLKVFLMCVDHVIEFPKNTSLKIFCVLESVHPDR